MRVVRSLLCFGVLCGVLALGENAHAQFIRSDVDMDSQFGLTDTIFLASYLYTAGPSPHMESGDVNDNGDTEIGDIVYHIKFLFLSGPVPPMPYPAAGMDTTPTAFAPALDSGMCITASDLTAVPGDTGLPIDIRVDCDKPIEAIEVAMTYDEASLQVDDILLIDTALATHNVEYLRKAWSNQPGDGYLWVAAVMDFTPPYDGHAVPAGTGHLIATVMTSIPATATVPLTTFVEFADVSLTPMKRTLAVSEGGTTRRMVENNSLLQIQLPFIRGDTNGDTLIDISDTVYNLFYFFNSGPVPPCEDAADSNNDGTLNIADAIFLLQYLFNDGPFPSEPFPEPGLDPDSDSLGCAG